MKNFCLYNGKKTVKPETWNITSVELSSDYTSAIIQAESKVSTSQHTLDITLLISNQYKNGIDPYSATVVNELTGVSDWILDPDNNQIVYTIPRKPLTGEYVWRYVDSFDTALQACQSTLGGATGYTFHRIEYYSPDRAGCFFRRISDNAVLLNGQIDRVLNPNYDPNAQEGQKTLPLDVVSQKVISNAESGDSSAQQAIISAFNNVTDGILTSDYSEFFEVNKQPK